MTRDQGARRLPEPTFEPPPLPPGFPRWKRFAWDGWDLTIPVDWDLGAIEFGPKGGFLRLDDEFEPRLMLKWQPIQHGFDPAKAIEKYLGKRLKGGDAKPRLGAAIPGIREALKGMEHETYTLVTSSQPTYKAWGLSAYCPRCRRAFVVEMSTDSRVDDSERQVARVLGSLREHTDERLTRWEAFGLSCDLPSELRAAETRFSQGFVSMAAGERGRHVEVARWSLAGIHLAGMDLRRFFSAYLLKARNSQRLHIEDAAVLSHPGLQYHSPRRVLEPLRAGIRRRLAVYRPAHLTGMLWHCATSNRILMLNLASNTPNDIGAARLLASRVRCCKVMF